MKLEALKNYWRKDVKVEFLEEEENFCCFIYENLQIPVAITAVSVFTREISETVFKQWWGNGYVAIADKNHPLYGECDDEKLKRCHEAVHGGLTFLEMVDDIWVIGFDTRHGFDTLESCPKQYVKENALALYKIVKRWGL